jgi:transcription elongation factor B subunit 1
MSSNDYVRIESADGYTFVVARNVACASGMLKTSLDTESKWSTPILKLMNRGLWGIKFRSLQTWGEVWEKIRGCANDRGVIVAKVIEYLSYKVQYADFNAADIKDDFTDRIDPYIALELWVLGIRG